MIGPLPCQQGVQTAPPAGADASPAEGLSAAARSDGRGKGKGKGKGRSKVVEKKYFGTCIQLIKLTRFAPTLQLFDGLWRVFLHVLEHVYREPHAAAYLRATYFSSPTLTNAQQQFKLLGHTAWKTSDILVAGHWYGILGTAPGTGTGSQSIEARHADWQEKIRSRCSASLLTIFDAMQELYSDWVDTFSWGSEVSFANLPRTVNEVFVNGSGLARLGRSTAVEFWKKRGQGNFVQLSKQTGSTADGPAAQTQFYVVRA